MAITVRPLRFLPRVLSERDSAVWITSKPIPVSGAPALKATRFHETSEGFVLGAQAVIAEAIKSGWKQPVLELFVTAANAGLAKQGYEAIKLWLADKDTAVNGHLLSLELQSSTPPVGLAFKIRNRKQDEEN